MLIYLQHCKCLVDRSKSKVKNVWLIDQNIKLSLNPLFSLFLMNRTPPLITLCF